MSDKEKLIHEFESDGDQYFESGRGNNLLDIGLSIAAILASLLATGLAGLGSKWTGLVAAVAALPAAFGSIQSVLNTQGRSEWYFRSAAAVRALALELTYDKSPDLAEYARKRGNLEIKMEEEWQNQGRGAKPFRSLSRT
jgi:hypothetical protein